MKRFLFKILIFSIFLILSFTGIILLEDGKADPFYLRFTSPKQTSLILGNSKAAQGIIPSIINAKSGDISPSNLYNYSFTVNTSPYGPIYLNSIQQKLNSGLDDGLFIVTVDPWSLSSVKNDPNNQELFIERKGFLSALFSVSSCPNFQYFANWYQNSFYEILLMKITKAHSILHLDGWYETGEAANREIRIKFMVDLYNKILQESAFSEVRYNSLDSTVAFLKKRGKVFLIRMPVHKDIYKIENELVSDFNLKIEMIANKHNVSYYDFSQDEEWDLKDGVHLTKSSAHDFSILLSRIIINNKLN